MKIAALKKKIEELKAVCIDCRDKNVMQENEAAAFVYRGKVEALDQVLMMFEQLSSDCTMSDMYDLESR